MSCLHFLLCRSAMTNAGATFAMHWLTLHRTIWVDLVMSVLRLRHLLQYGRESKETLCMQFVALPQACALLHVVDDHVLFICFCEQMHRASPGRSWLLSPMPADVQNTSGLQDCSYASSFVFFFRDGWLIPRFRGGGSRMPHGHRQSAGEQRRLRDLSYKVCANIFLCFTCPCKSFFFREHMRTRAWQRAIAAWRGWPPPSPLPPPSPAWPSCCIGMEFWCWGGVLYTSFHCLRSVANDIAFFARSKSHDNEYRFVADVPEHAVPWEMLSNVQFHSQFCCFFSFVCRLGVAWIHGFILLLHLFMYLTLVVLLPRRTHCNVAASVSFKCIYFFTTEDAILCECFFFYCIHEISRSKSQNIFSSAAVIRNASLCWFVSCCFHYTVALLIHTVPTATSLCYLFFASTF